MILGNLQNSKPREPRNEDTLQEQWEWREDVFRMPFRAGQLGRRQMNGDWEDTNVHQRLRKFMGGWFPWRTMEFQELETVPSPENGHAGGIENSKWAKYLYKKHLNTHIPASAVAESWCLPWDHLVMFICRVQSFWTDGLEWQSLSTWAKAGELSESWYTEPWAPRPCSHAPIFSSQNAGNLAEASWAKCWQVSHGKKQPGQQILRVGSPVKGPSLFSLQWSPLPTHIALANIVSGQLFGDPCLNTIWQPKISKHLRSLPSSKRNKLK